MTYVRLYLALFGFNSLIAFAVYLWMPDYKYQLLREDQLVENLSALFFFLTFAVSFFYFFKSNHHRKALIVVSMISLLGFLDEISFGERLFGLDMPYLGGVKIDSAHDFFYLGFIFISRLSFSQSLIMYLIVVLSIVGIVVAFIKYQNYLKTVIRKGHFQPQLILLIFFAFLIFSSLVIDLDLVKHDILFMFEEWFEMNAAIALLFCSMSLYHGGSDHSIRGHSTGQERRLDRGRRRRRRRRNR